VYSSAVGFSPGRSVLSGLQGKKGSAGQLAYGQGMAAAAGLGLEREQQNQQAGLRQMNQQFQLARQGEGNKARSAGNQISEQASRDQRQGQNSVFNTNMNYSYRQLAKRKWMEPRQALLNAFARSM
jgi:hypothetical protein